MELPSRFSNQRFATSDSTVSAATTLGLILWVSSTVWYKKQFFKRDHRDYLNLVLFSFGSLFSSVASARFLLESPYAAAARRNNWNELKHQRQLRHE